MQCIAVKC